LPVPHCKLKVTPFVPNHDEVNPPPDLPPKKDVCELYVEDTTFTAFIGCGYDVLPASSVLNSKYVYIFIPVCNANQYKDGKSFLESLQGSGYNYFGLPLTVLPNAFKPPVRDSEFISHGAPSRVFCSQVGLMLLYRCGMAPQTGIDPSCCTPGNLQTILKQPNVGGVDCYRNCIRVSNPILHSRKPLMASTSAWYQSLF
jgi:hypothetical protein